MKTPEDVHIFLLKTFGRKYSKILSEKTSEFLGRPVSAQSISKTINGKQVNQPTREAIAKVSGMPTDEMWEPEFDYNTGLKKRGKAA